MCNKLLLLFLVVGFKKKKKKHLIENQPSTVFSQAQMSTMFIPLPPLISNKSTPTVSVEEHPTHFLSGFPHSLLWTGEETNHDPNSWY